MALRVSNCAKYRRVSSLDLEAPQGSQILVKEGMLSKERGIRKDGYGAIGGFKQHIKMALEGTIDLTVKHRAA